MPIINVTVIADFVTNLLDRDILTARMKTPIFRVRRNAYENETPNKEIKIINKLTEKKLNPIVKSA